MKNLFASPHLSFIFYVIALMTTQAYAQWFSNGAEEYFISNDQGNYSSAISKCIKLNATLIVLSDAGKFANVNNKLKEENKTTDRFYVYASRFRPGAFEWGDGTSPFPGGARWKPGGANNVQYNCVAMIMKYPSTVFSMYPVPCSGELLNYICERSAGQIWLVWNPWSQCSSSCNPRIRIRTRGCSIISSIGTNYCVPALDDIESEPCIFHLCNDTVETTIPCNTTCDETGESIQLIECQTNKTLTDEYKPISAVVIGGSVTGGFLLLIIFVMVCCVVRAKTSKTEENVCLEELERADDRTYSRIVETETQTTLFNGYEVVDIQNKGNAAQSMPRKETNAGTHPAVGNSHNSSNVTHNQINCILNYTEVKKSSTEISVDMGSENVTYNILKNCSKKEDSSEYDTLRTDHLSSINEEMTQKDKTDEAYNHLQSTSQPDKEKQGHTMLDDEYSTVEYNVKEVNEYDTLQHAAANDKSSFGSNYVTIPSTSDSKNHFDNSYSTLNIAQDKDNFTEYDTMTPR